MIGTTIGQGLALIAALLVALGLWSFLWGFVNYIFAGRNEEELAPARVHMTRGTIAVGIVYAVWLLARLLLQLLGISLY